MSELTDAIDSLNKAAARADTTTVFFDDVTTGGDSETVTNPNNNKTVPTVQKQVADLYAADSATLTAETLGFRNETEGFRNEAESFKDDSAISAASASDSASTASQDVATRTRKVINELSLEDVNSTEISQVADLTIMREDILLTEFSVEDDTFTYSRSGAGNSFARTWGFTPDLTKLVYVKFNASFANVGTTAGAIIQVADTQSGGGDFSPAIGTFYNANTHTFSFDPNVYFDLYGTTEFFLWINNTFMSSGTINVTFENFIVYQEGEAFSGNVLAGGNSKDLFESTDAALSSLQNTAVALSNVKNGTDVVYETVQDISGGAAIEINIPDDYFVYEKEGAGNSWVSTGQFTPEGAYLVNISFDVEFNNTGTSAGISIAVAEGTTASTFYEYIHTTTEDGTVNITFDPAYYSVYQGLSDFYVWIINSEGITTGKVINAKISNFKVYQTTAKANTSNISGDNAKELFESVDAALGESSTTESSGIITGSGGDKFEISANNAGVLTLLPVVPSKGAVFGNSLLLGFATFGMAASAIDKDYYALVTDYITGIKPTFTCGRFAATEIEALDNAADIDSTIQTVILDNLVGDEEFIVIQLGDNVNTAGKLALWGDVTLSVLQAIRNKCQGARVFWMGMWYSSTEKYADIQNACTVTGSTFVSMEALRVDGASSFIGALSDRGQAVRTVLNVTSVVENTPINITVTFASGGASYSATIDVDSYSLDSTTLTYDSIYYVVTNSGVASHPGDEGFRLIANKLLYTSKISSSEEAYI